MPEQLQTVIPVFCTARIPVETIDKFFTDGYKAPELEGADWLGVLVNTEDLTSIAEPSQAPVTPPTAFPFEDYSVDQVVEFARENFDGVHIVSRVIAILDKRTLEDQTCLLVTERELTEGELLTVRSDFRSAMVTLNVKNLGVGGDEHFEPTGSDGVIRIGSV